MTQQDRLAVGDPYCQALTADAKAGWCRFRDLLPSGRRMDHRLHLQQHWGQPFLLVWLVGGADGRLNQPIRLRADPSVPPSV